MANEISKINSKNVVYNIRDHNITMLEQEANRNKVVVIGDDAKIGVDDGELIFTKKQSAADEGKLYFVDSEGVFKAMDKPIFAKRNMIYSAGAIVLSSQLGPMQFLRCTKSGKTAMTPPVISGTVIVDGTVEWTVGTIPTKITTFDKTEETYYFPELFSTNKTTVSIPIGTRLLIDDEFYELMSTFIIDLTTVPGMQTGVLRGGKDIYLYGCKPESGTEPVFVASFNSTVPDGYTADNSRKIGGFHCLYADVDGFQFVRINGTSANNALSGYSLGDIMPTSRWDLNHRPVSNPEGMVYCDAIDKWIGIYLTSWDSISQQIVSVAGGMVADGIATKKWHSHAMVEQLALQKMRFPTFREMQIFSKGVVEQRRLYSRKHPTETGGHTTDASLIKAGLPETRIISSFGGEDVCGVMWQWTNDEFTWRGTYSTTNYTYNVNVDPKDVIRGGVTTGRRVVFGGAWNVASDHCGTRSAIDCAEAEATDTYTGRMAAEPKIAYIGYDYIKYSPVI